MKKRNERYSPEQLVNKLRDAEVTLNGGKSIEEALKTLEISEATFHPWRNQYEGIKSEDVIDRLVELFAMHGVPECIWSDNGPMFVAKAIQQWLSLLEIKTLYVEPASQWQNGYAESF